MSSNLQASPDERANSRDATRPGLPSPTHSADISSSSADMPTPSAEAPANLALRVRDLSKSYRVYAKPFDRLKEMLLRRPFHEKVDALKPLSFDVPRGQCVGVVGANGAGKTTLLSLLTGTLTPTTGTIEVFGRVSAILALGVGMLPTHTGRENIRHGLITRGIPFDQHADLEAKIIDFCELGDAIDKPVQTYSTGMAMRLNFSIAHSIEPDILIVDEALAVGDARFISKCQRKMREFLDRRKTLFFVSHNTTMIRELCTRAILLKQGNLLLDGDVRDVLHRYRSLYFEQPAAPAQAPVQAPSQAAPQSPSTSQPPSQPAPAPETKLHLVAVDVPGHPRLGPHTWEITQGDPLLIRYTVRTDIDIHRPSVGVVFQTGFRNPITGCSTTHQSLPLRTIRAGETFAFDYEMPTFLPAATYQCEVIIADLATEPPTLLATWEETCNLIVRWADYSHPGVIDAGASIHFESTVYSLAHEKARRDARKAAGDQQ